jgi:hypothetical protein
MVGFPRVQGQRGLAAPVGHPPAGSDNPKIDEIQRAAAADVEEIEEEGRRYFRQDGPGSQEDDL